MLRSLTDNKAQVAFEFVMLVAILFTVLIVFTSFVRDNFTEVETDTDHFKLKDLAISIKSELNLAIVLEDGYQRYFYIPLTLDGLEYNITRDDGILLFESANAEYSVSVPQYTGTLQKGNNLIRKNSGAIEVNT